MPWVVLLELGLPGELLLVVLGSGRPLPLGLLSGVVLGRGVVVVGRGSVVVVVEV